MKLVVVIAFFLPVIYGQIDELEVQTTETKLHTHGREVPMTNRHPARASLYISAESGNGERNILTSENTDTLASGTKMGYMLFEQFTNSKFVRVLRNLPPEGIVKNIPWPSDYWPNYRDGLNFRRNPGQPTAIEKYARAFDLNARAISDEISKISGVDAWTSRPSCMTDNDCFVTQDQSKCSIREGQSRGYCIPSWYGICHAWAPASIMEPEPRCPVNYKGVMFDVMDLKGLITQLYDGTGYGTVFAGSRCNSERPSEDQYSRYSETGCRDATPDFIHLVLANMIGRFNQSLLMDVTAGAEVWNQPIISYSVLQTQAVSGPQAAGLISPGLSSYIFNTNAVSFHYYRTQMNYVAEGSADGPLGSLDIVGQFVKTKELEYILELDAAGVIVGGEWLGASKTDHPDFVWKATSRPADDTVIAGGIRYDIVRQLVERSAAC